jgi:hypothetical protein
MPKQRLYDDWDGEPIPPQILDSLNRQILESEGQPTRPLQEALEEIRRKLREFEDAQGRVEPSSQRAVA